MSLNKVMLIGNVGADPEVKTIGTNSMVNLTLATTEKWLDRSGNQQERTEWHNLSFFGKMAENVAKYVTKGSSLYIEGRLRYNQKEEGGEKKYYTNINVDNWQFVGAKKSNNNEPEDDGDLPY